MRIPALVCLAAAAACSSDGSSAPGTTGQGGSTSTDTTTTTGSAGSLSSGPGGATAGSGGATGAVGSSGGGGVSTGTGGSIGTGGGSGGSMGSGGSAGSMGTGDASVDASGTDGGLSNCNGAILCDSFERADLGPDWTLDNSVPATKIEIVSNKAHTGTSSVHISFGMTATQSYISEKTTFPPTGGAFWGRAWIFAMLPLSGHQIYVEARVASGSDGTGVRPVNTQGTNLALNLESTDAGTNSNIKMPMGSWACYEWQITGIGGNGTFSAYVDGMKIGTQNGAIPNLMRQRIGFQRYAGGTAGEMWIDDVAIGPNRIGCM